VVGDVLSLGQRTVEQLVDRHSITCRPMRDLFVDYLRERQPAINYSPWSDWPASWSPASGPTSNATSRASTRCGCPARSPGA
jgi:hypothetical protein